MSDLLTITALQEMWRGEVKQISWSPRAFVFKGLLSDEECDYLINNVSTGVACDGICLYSLLCPLMFQC